MGKFPLMSQYGLHVSENVLQNYKPTLISKIEKNTNHLSTYQNLIHQLHYARFIPEEQRRETYLESVLRFMAYITEHCKNLGYQLTEQEFIELHNSIIKLDVFPSMRLLWCAGEAVKNNFSSLFNCLRNSTEFITNKGVKTFLDFEDGDEITVLSHDGTWNNAVVHNYGKQKLYKIGFSRGKSKDHIVYATKNHRWVLSDDSETTDLKVGDYVKASPNIFDDFNYENASLFEKLYWCYGFIYGDGSKIKNDKGEYTYSLVRLCGDKKIFEKRFTEIGFLTSSPLSVKGDIFVYTGSYLKTLPDLELDSCELIRAFVCGYLSADGGKNNNVSMLSKYCNIQVTGEEGIEFVRKAFPVAGVTIISEKDLTGQITNYGTRTDKTVYFTISTNLNNKTNAKWTVKSIEETDLIEDVWCLEVENTHTFVLANGIVTGNCSFIGIKDIEAFAEILFLGMSGVGVGFSVEDKYISQLPVVPSVIKKVSNSVSVEDSREGWAIALKRYIECLYEGIHLFVDVSQIRPAGMRLIKSGGFSSGPEAFIKLMKETENIFYAARGRKLKPIECHDLVCFTAEAAVAGGTRRCLPKGTLIATSQGDVPIEKIEVGMFIYSYYKGKIILKNVLAKECVGDKFLCKITTKYGTISASNEHRFPISFNYDGSPLVYKKACELQKGDILVAYNIENNSYYERHPLRVAPILSVDITGESEECWDIQIADTELFFANKHLTHNSALISFSDLTDKEMQAAKSGEWWKENGQRALANNSAVYTEKPDFNIFDQEWQNLVESKSGERGIFNEYAVLRKSNQIGRRDPTLTYRSNPCLTPETLVVTKKGIIPIAYLVDQKVDIWNGRKWESVDTFRQTGENQPILKFTFYDGYEIRVTPEHTLYLKDGTPILAKNVITGMELLDTKVPVIQEGIEDNSSYLKAFLLMQGDVNPATENVYLRLGHQYKDCFMHLCDALSQVPFDNPQNEEDFKDISYEFIRKQNGDYILPGLADKQKTLYPWCLKKNMSSGLLYALQLDFKSRINFIKGMYDAKGVALDDNGEIHYGMRFSFYEEGILFNALLYSIGIHSLITHHAEKNQTEYTTVYCKNRQAIKLTNIVFFERLGFFKNCHYKEELHPEYTTVIDIQEDGIAEKVYCCTVPSNHKFTLANMLVVGNCSEIQLQHRQFCNLSNVNIRIDDTLSSLVQKVKLATIFGTIQSSITDFQFLNSEWKKNTESERLLGVSLSGIADNPHFFPHKISSESLDSLRKNLQYLRYIAVHTNREWARKLSISPSNAITTIKPSGDSSQLADTSSGIHPRYSPYYIRRIRMNMLDPIAQQLIEKNIPYEISINGYEYVFSFPQCSPKHSSVFGSNLHPLDHFKIWLEYSKYWSEHLVSCTIMVHNNEQWEDLRNALYMKFDEVCGLSFLPYDDHIYQQAPYEEIDKYQYEQLLLTIPKIDFSTFKESSDRTLAPIACAGSMCEIKFN